VSLPAVNAPAAIENEALPPERPMLDEVAGPLANTTVPVDVPLATVTVTVMLVLCAVATLDGKAKSPTGGDRPSFVDPSTPRASGSFETVPFFSFISSPRRAMS
jgi:hypothetical protein